MSATAPPALTRTQPGPAIAWLLLAAAALSGIAIIFVGATTRNAWLLQLHIASVGGGIRGARRMGHLAVASSRHATRTRAIAAIAMMTVVLIGAVAAAAGYRQDARRRETFRIVNPDIVPARMEEEGAGPSSPFFPSSANTTVNATIPANFFLTSAACARCHREIYDQWNSSAHHFSSFNNQWYRKSIEYMQDVVGTTAVEMVRGMPRPCGVLQWTLRQADTGADPDAGSTGRPGVHVVSRHHACEQHDGTG